MRAVLGLGNCSGHGNEIVRMIGRTTKVLVEEAAGA
jgi:hypothetical protein